MNAFKKPKAERQIRPEPRWTAALAILAAAAMPFALPRSLNVVPQWIVATSWSCS